MSGSAFSYFALTETNHVEKMQECAHTRNVKQIIEYIKVADFLDIIQCHFKSNWGKTLKPEWVPTIEAPGTINGFITESPEVIWTSRKAPVMDTLFTSTSEVS